MFPLRQHHALPYCLGACLYLLALTSCVAAEMVSRYGYTGRELDGSDILYFRGRYLDPSLGRFTQRDPLGLGGGIADYAYAGNEPVAATDPSGLAPSDKFAGVLGKLAYYTRTGDGLNPAIYPSDFGEMSPGQQAYERDLALYGAGSAAILAGGAGIASAIGAGLATAQASAGLTSAVAVAGYNGSVVGPVRGVVLAHGEELLGLFNLPSRVGMTVPQAGKVFDSATLGLIERGKWDLLAEVLNGRVPAGWSQEAAAMVQNSVLGMRSMLPGTTYASVRLLPDARLMTMKGALAEVSSTYRQVYALAERGGCLVLGACQSGITIDALVRRGKIPTPELLHQLGLD